MNARLITTTTFTLAALCAACGSEEHGAEACAAVSATPTPLTAGTSSATAALIAPSETPYQIALPAGMRGYLKLSITGDTALIAAFKSTGVLGPVTLAGAPVTVGAAEPLDACATDIPAHHDLDLETAGDYVLTVGPVVGDQAWMFLDVATDHAH